MEVSLRAAGSSTEVQRIQRLVRHLAPVLTNGASVRAKSFLRGLLAHLIIVPAWVIPPGALFGSLVLAGAPLGLKGILATMGVGAGLVSGPKKMRPAFCAIALLVAAASKKTKAAVAAVVASFLTWLVSRQGKIPRYPWLFNFVSTWAKDYYSNTALRGALDDIRPNKSFLGFHPHGCLCAGFTINCTYNPDFIRACTKVSFLCDPALRHKNPGFQLMSEAYEADDRTIEACDPEGFKHHMQEGTNVAFIPGGFMDAVAYEFGKDVCVLSSKKGFIKYCLQSGYRAHPVYTFGECETYHTFTGLQSFRMRVAAQNVPALAFFGWPLVPFLPRPQSQILTYVGPGIDMPHIPSPTHEDVDQWHQVYVDALRKLFDDNKADAGYPNAQLEIL